MSVSPSSILALSVVTESSGCNLRLILGWLRLNASHLTREDTRDLLTKSNSFGKPTMHSSSASITRYVMSKLESCRILVKISDRVTQVFVSLKRALPA